MRKMNANGTVYPGGFVTVDDSWLNHANRTGGVNAAPTPGTERGVDPQSINSYQARIVWQISQNTKLSAYNDRLLKNRGSDMTAGVDPATASAVWTSPIYTTGSIKVSSTVSSHVLVEAGVSTNYERYNIFMQPGILRQRGAPEWYTAINKQDFSLGASWNGFVERGPSGNRGRRCPRSRSRWSRTRCR